MRKRGFPRGGVPWLSARSVYFAGGIPLVFRSLRLLAPILYSVAGLLFLTLALESIRKKEKESK